LENKARMAERQIEERRAEEPAVSSSMPAAAILLFGLIANLAPLLTFAAALHEIAEDWRMSAGEAGWIGGIFFAGYSLAVPLLGSLSDRIDARRLYAGCCLLGAAASFAFAGWAHGFAPAMLLRFIAGIAFAGVHMPGLKLLVDRVPNAEPRAAGLYTSSYAVGGAVSLILAGTVGAAFGWRATFIAAGIGPLLALAALAWLPPAAPRPARAPTPLFSYGPVLRNRAAMAYIAGFAGNTWEVFAVRVWFVSYLAWSLDHAGDDLSLPPLGVVAGLASLAALPVSIGVAALAARWRRERVIAAACAVSVAVCVALAVTAGGSALTVLTLLVLVQITSFADVGALAGGAVAAAEPERRGTTLALFALAGYFTGFLGPVAVGLAVDAFGGSDSPAGWRAAFVVIAFGSAAAAIAVSCAPRR
jgi:MFS family permease